MEERASREPALSVVEGFGRARTPGAPSRSVFLNKMYDLQTFTNFFFSPPSLKEQYDLLAGTRFKESLLDAFHASSVLRCWRSDLIMPRSSYA
jgi:hypothetical protein